MLRVTSAGILFLAAGIFTSVSVLSAFQILFGVSLIYYLIQAVKKKDLKLPVSAWFLLAFTLVALLGLILNYDLIPKPSKNFGRLKYFVFGVAGIYVMRAWLTGTSDKVKKVLTSVFFVSIIVASSFAIHHFFNNPEGDRIRGLTDTMRYGYGLGMILLTILAGILHREKIQHWYDYRLASAALVMGFTGMYLTNTRGALLGFLCGLPFVLYFYRKKWGLVVGGAAALTVAVLASFYLFGSGQYSSRYLTNKSNNSDVMRRSQWESAIIATKEKPLLGWGLSNFHTQLKRIKHQYDLDAKYYDDAHAHNLFLEIASGTGLIGLFLFLGWVFTWAWEVFRAQNIITAMILPFGVAFVVSSQFEVTFDANNASMIFFLYSLSSVRKEHVK